MQGIALLALFVATALAFGPGGPQAYRQAKITDVEPIHQFISWDTGNGQIGNFTLNITITATLAKVVMVPEFIDSLMKTVKNRAAVGKWADIPAVTGREVPSTPKSNTTIAPKHKWMHGAKKNMADAKTQEKFTTDNPAELTTSTAAHTRNSHDQSSSEIPTTELSEETSKIVDFTGHSAIIESTTMALLVHRTAQLEEENNESKTNPQQGVDNDNILDLMADNEKLV